MILNNCTTCAVYMPDLSQRRIQVTCSQEQILLLLKRESELPDLAKVRIDFFDGQIGCIKADCELAVRQNYDPSITTPWVADCEILEVLEIIEGRKSVRATMEKEATFSAPGKEEFKGVIQNISEGGIYFITRTRLQCNDAVKFSYCFLEKEYRMEVVILREEDLRDGRYGYGCQFLMLPLVVQKDIRQYVYLRQQGMIW